MRRLLPIAFFIVVVSFFGSRNTPVFAQSIDDIKRKIEEYEAQIVGLHSKANTLTNQIAQFNAQIALTTLKITKTEDEIALLGTRITSLETSLANLTRAYSSRVIETYRIVRLGSSPFIILSSSDLNESLSRFEYLKLAAEADYGLLSRLTKAQTGYKDQKQEQEALNVTLSQQKKSLDGQKVAKAQLLTVTQNDEKKYQALLADAQRQLAAFQNFTKGAAVLNNQTKCDSWGCYYNQRDSEWANNLIGLSPYSLKDVGCLITSMAMVATHFGKNLKPNDIASNSSPFLGTTAYMVQGSWSVSGVTMNRTRLGSNTSAIDNELSSGRPVIVGIYGGPDHFLVIKKKDNGSYIMNDPFVENGHDVKFTDHYPLSAISAVDRVTVN